MSNEVKQEKAVKQKKPFYKRFWFFAVVALVFIIAVSGGDDEQIAEEADTEVAAAEENAENNVSNEGTENEVVENEPENEPVVEEEPENEPVVEEEPEPDYVSFGSGMKLVGSDIQPGIYRAEGTGYWERLSGVSGEFDDIIANDNAENVTYVEIKESDEAFNSSRFDEWRLIDESYQPEIESEFGAGMYLVGVDIEPGRYRAEGSGYWARLSGVSGTFEDLIANDNFEESTIVDISESDYAFVSSRVNSWTKVE